MHRANLWNKTVMRAKHDARAREARLQLQRLERLLVHRPTAMQQVRLWGRLLSLAISVVTLSQDETTGSPSDQRPFGIPPAVPMGMFWQGLRPV
jgi:hypothetical protein